MISAAPVPSVSPPQHSGAERCDLKFEYNIPAPAGVKDFSFANHSRRETPLPIPNREVKPPRADGTARATGWESRSFARDFFRVKSLNLIGFRLFKFIKNQFRRSNERYSENNYIIPQGSILDSHFIISILIRDYSDQYLKYARILHLEQKQILCMGI